jgi:hypothetical protein
MPIGGFNGSDASPTLAQSASWMEATYTAQTVTGSRSRLTTG